MPDGLMHVITFDSALCVIRVGGGGLLALGFFMWLPLWCLLTLAARFSPWLHSRIGHGWGVWIPILLVSVGFSAFLAGEKDVLTLSRDAGTLQIATTKFFLFRNTQTIALKNVYSASNTGRYNQFQVNLADGNYIRIGNDTTEGGRAESADAMNQWLRQYRGETTLAPSRQSQ